MSFSKTIIKSEAKSMIEITPVPGVRQHASSQGGDAPERR